jgi:trigger factor
VTAEEFDGLQALKDRLRSDMLERKQAEEDQRFRSEAIDGLVAGASIEYPEIMVEHEIDHVVKDMTGSEMSQYAAHLQRIGRSEAEFKSQFREAAIERLKRGLVLAKLTEAEGIDATEADIDAEMDRIVAPMPEEDGARFRELFASPEGIDSIKRNIISQRTLERLVTIARGEATETAKAPSAAKEEEPE